MSPDYTNDNDLNIKRLHQVLEDACVISIYLITFQVLVESIGGSEDWIQDELRVTAGRDAQDAVDRAEEYALSGTGVKLFRLRAVKPLAEAEV